MSWGVTVVTATMKDNTRKTVKDFVIHKPSHYEGQHNFVLCVGGARKGLTMVAVMATRQRTKARRRKMSPRGHKKSRPEA
jgi:hypothetical protein